MATAWFDGVSFSLDIDFTKGGRQTPTGFTSGMETRIRELTISRGRSSERDTFQVGTFQAVMDNRDHLLDPEYTAGTHYGNLLPMRWLRMSMTYSATEYPMFFGHIQGWPQTWELSDNDFVVNLVAHDPMFLAGTATAPESEWAAAAVSSGPGAAWYRLGEEDGAVRVIDARDPSVSTYWGYYGDASAVLADGLITNSTNGSRRVTGLGKLDSSLVAYGLRGIPAGTGGAVDLWVRGPSTGSGSSRQYLYGQSPITLPMTDSGGIGEVFPVATGTSPVILLWINTNTDKIHFEVSDGSVTQFGESSAAGASRVAAIFDDRPHHLVLDRSGATITVYLDGASLPMTLTGTAITSGSVDFGAAFIGPIHEGVWDLDEYGIHASSQNSTYWEARYALGTAPGLGDTITERIERIANATGITTPLGDDLDTSEITCQSVDYGGGSANILGLIRQLEETEAGRIFYNRSGALEFHSRWHDVGASIAAAFSDDPGSSLPYAQGEHEFDHTRILNDATVSRDNGTPQNYADATSVTTYGRRTGGSGSLVYRTDAEALAHAQYLTNYYKDPRGRIRSLVVKPRAKPATLVPVVGALEIGSIITFERNVTGGTTFTYTLSIEGIQHRISARGDWTVTYLTAPAGVVEVARWDEGVWDQSKWGF